MDQHDLQVHTKVEEIISELLSAACRKTQSTRDISRVRQVLRSVPDTIRPDVEAALGRLTKSLITLSWV